MSSTESTITTDNNKSFNWTWVQTSWAWALMMSKTAIALLFIVNNVALGLFAFGLVEPSKGLASAFGAVSIAFAAIVLFTFVHYGVKYQANPKRKK